LVENTNRNILIEGVRGNFAIFAEIGREYTDRRCPSVLVLPQCEVLLRR